jgi:hypothetical protein
MIGPGLPEFLRTRGTGAGHPRFNLTFRWSLAYQEARMQSVSFAFPNPAGGA